MSSHKNFCALTVSMIVGASCCVPSYAQHKMSLQSLFDLADRQNQRIKVSEVALKAADEGVASAKSAMLLFYQWHYRVYCPRIGTSTGAEWQTAHTTLGQQLYSSGQSGNLCRWSHSFRH